MTQRISANEQPRRIIASLVIPKGVGSGVVYSENHTNFIEIGDEVKGSFLLGALNSSMMEFVFRRLNSNTQVSAGELNALPFPPMPDADACKEIVDIVAHLLQYGGVDCQPAHRARMIGYERQLDVLTGGLYGFSADEVERVQRGLPTYETVYGLKD